MKKLSYWEISVRYFVALIELYPENITLSLLIFVWKKFTFIPHLENLDDHEFREIFVFCLIILYFWLGFYL